MTSTNFRPLTPADRRIGGFPFGYLGMTPNTTSSDNTWYDRFLVLGNKLGLNFSTQGDGSTSGAEIQLVHVLATQLGAGGDLDPTESCR